MKRTEKSRATESDLRRYLEDSDPVPDKREDWLRRWNELRYRVHRKGRERITIMIVPHTESSILNLHISNYTLFSTIGIVALFLTVSLITIMNRSAETIQFYDMGLTNSQFHIQSSRLAEEIIPLHERISIYTNTVASIHTRLSGRENDLPARGGAATQVVEREIQDLTEMIEQCKQAGERCEQHRIEGILRRSLYLAILDNEQLKQAIDITDKIIEDLNTPEKQHLLRITPNIWPVRGSVAVPYGSRFDALRGNGQPLRGVWFHANPGSEVSATAPGKVSEISYSRQFGLYLWVEHPIGIRTFYAGLDRVTVNAGDTVEKGQVIGTVGRSANPASNMLYYELHIGTVAYNPHSFLNHLQSLWLNPQNL
jgi:hypothetical protein